MIMFKIETSRTLNENPSKNWRQDWNVHTFLRALEEVYALEPKDRFMESTSIWQSITYELRGTLHVDPRNMHELSETYVAALVDLYQVLKDLLYAFIGTGNPWKDKNPNRTFYQEFKKALRDDEEHQSNMSLTLGN